MRRRSPLAAFAGIFSVTLLSLMGVGAVLPVLPLYVRGPLSSGDFAVGVVIGAFAFTALGVRPLAGHLADLRGRRPVVVTGSLLAALAGALYLIPAGMPGLIAARLVLGAGEGMVFTAGATWVVDLAPPERRGRVLGLYGLAVWTGLSLGPPIGDALLRASSFDAVWAFAAASPAIGAMVALQVPDPFRPGERVERRPLIAPESLGPGIALSLATVGYAAMASFIVLDVESHGSGHGAVAFTAFAATVVVTRLVLGGLPDRIGPLRCAAGAAAVETIGLALIALSNGLPLALAGSVAMGGAFSLLYPALSLLVVNRVPYSRRGSALGTFTAFFDLGVGLGGPLTGAAAALTGYSGAFWLAAACGLASGAVIALHLGGRSRARLVPAGVAVLALTVVAGPAGCGSGPASAAHGPNIVVVMTDDQDVRSLAVMGNVRQELVAKGVTFEHNFTTTPECCPSRATFLTGQYAHNHGVLSSRPPYGYRALDGSNTLATWLQSAGYRTAYFGKYLNGYGTPRAHAPLTAIPPGWDDWHVPVRHTEYQMYGYTLNENGSLHTYGHRASDYETDVLARGAAAYVKQTAKSRQPFFMTVAPSAPHGEGVLEGRPHVTRDPRPAPRDLGTFQNRPVPHPPSYDVPSRIRNKPDVLRNRAARTEVLLHNGTIQADYRGRLESLLAVDRLVSRVVRALREAGKLANTDIIFTSDNGFLLGEHRLEGKNLPYEESATVPLVMRGPGLPEGATRRQLVANIDLAPTILDMAGASAGLEMDGTSLLPVATRNAPLRRDILLEYLLGRKAYAAIRTPGWMLSNYAQGGSEMYDLRRDPYEVHNLANDPRYSGVRERLSARLASLRHCAGAACG